MVFSVKKSWLHTSCFVLCRVTIGLFSLAQVFPRLHLHTFIKSKTAGRHNRISQANRINTSAQENPHIVFILADDLGFNDIGYHAVHHHSAIRTPFLDQLAREGVILENYYVQPTCTPTRSQLLTGRYQIHTGLQHMHIRREEPKCLPLDEITLQQKLKESNYRTHLIGKWHLGFYHNACLPLNRGFDTFFGYLGGTECHYKHTASDYSDFYDNNRIAVEHKGKYSAFLFAERFESIVAENKQQPLFIFLSLQNVHIPLQVPEEYTKPFTHIKDRDRRTYAGMVSNIDDTVKRAITALTKHGLYNNTIIIFSTDNGGQNSKGGNNWPLRGGKGTLYEGGVRAVGFVHSPLLPDAVKGTVNKELIHVSDWFPSLVSGVAGGDLDDTKSLDSYNLWNTIVNADKSPRKEILHNIDPFVDKSCHTNPTIKGYQSEINDDCKYSTSFPSALRVGDMKIITGSRGFSRVPPPESSMQPLESPVDRKVLLFNITDDPNEEHNLATTFPDITAAMLDRLRVYHGDSVPVMVVDYDKNSIPTRHGRHYWAPWSTTAKFN